MFKSYIYIIFSLVFIVFGILIGWSLTFSDQFNHIDSKSQKKEILWWKVCILAICCSLILTISIFIAYKVYYGSLAGNNIQQNPWIDEWRPETAQETLKPIESQTKYKSPIKYPGIPLMETRGII